MAGLKRGPRCVEDGEALHVVRRGVTSSKRKVPSLFLSLSLSLSLISGRLMW